jgi:thiosulfate/3-mercaptopyruvate sulfurtransferase
MKKTLLLVIPLLLFGGFIGYSLISTSTPDTGGIQYVDAETFRDWLLYKKAIVVDVQTYDGYLKMHFPGSLTTHAYPVTSPSQVKQVEAIIPTLMASNKPVVLVCFGGITGAPNARNLLVSRGVPNRRLYVLKGGSLGFPYKDMMVSGGRDRMGGLGPLEHLTIGTLEQQNIRAVEHKNNRALYHWSGGGVL